MVEECQVGQSLCESRMGALNHRLDEVDRRLMQRFELTELALNKSAETLNARLETMNEFRSSLSDQARHFVTITQHDALADRMGRMEQAQTELLGRLNAIDTNMNRLMGVFIAVIIAVAIGLVTGSLHIGSGP